MLSCMSATGYTGRVGIFSVAYPAVPATGRHLSFKTWYSVITSNSGHFILPVKLAAKCSPVIWYFLNWLWIQYVCSIGCILYNILYIQTLHVKYAVYKSLEDIYQQLLPLSGAQSGWQKNHYSHQEPKSVHIMPRYVVSVYTWISLCG